MFKRKAVEKLKIHTVFRNTLFFWKILPFMRKCKKKKLYSQTTDDNRIQRMRFARWMINGTDTHSEYIILFCDNNGYVDARQLCIISANSLLVTNNY